MRFVTIAVFMFVGLSLFSQQAAPPLPKIKGMEKAAPNLLMGQEVSLQEWYNYLFALKSANNMPAFQEALPDSNTRNNECFFSDKGLTKTLFFGPSLPKTHVALKHGNLPLSGVSFEQAWGYCRWLTESSGTSSFIDEDGEMTKYRLVYRLPSPAELKSVTLSGMANSGKNPAAEQAMRVGRHAEKGCMAFNYKHDVSPTCEEDNALIKARIHGILPCEAFEANALGLFNLQGNVAEMTAMKGKAVGGSYTHLVRDCQPESTNTYTASTEWLGFRVVAELKPIDP